jgi:hypothetical protein
MNRLSNQIIEDFGGTTALAQLVKAPVSTVHSWRKSLIPPSRLDHLKLAAKAKGLKVSWDTLEAAGEAA